MSDDVYVISGIYDRQQSKIPAVSFTLASSTYEQLWSIISLFLFSSNKQEQNWQTTIHYMERIEKKNHSGNVLGNEIVKWGFLESQKKTILPLLSIILDPKIPTRTQTRGLCFQPIQVVSHGNYHGILHTITW